MHHDGWVWNGPRETTLFGPSGDVWAVRGCLGSPGMFGHSPGMFGQSGRFGRSGNVLLAGISSIFFGNVPARPGISPGVPGTSPVAGSPKVKRLWPCVASCATACTWSYPLHHPLRRETATLWAGVQLKRVESAMRTVSVWGHRTFGHGGG